MNYNIEGYTREEGRSYIELKLKKAGCTDQIFEDAAIGAILNDSDGTARMISKLCNTSLVIGHSRSAVFTSLISDLLPIPEGIVAALGTGITS